MSVRSICTNIAPLIMLAKNIVHIIKIAIPIILILLAMLDLGKMVVASKEDEIKKNQKMLIKRFIYAVLVFFVATLVQIVFGLFEGVGNDVEEDSTKWTNCWKCNDSKCSNYYVNH